MNYSLAIDIGASSGRHIVGWYENGSIQTDEVFRFPNGMVEENGHLVWDIDTMFGYVKEGIEKALDKYPEIGSLSVDTWGVDYVLMKGDEEVRPCYAYRDSRTDNSIPKVHEIMPFTELYSHTGTMFAVYNSIYKLYEDKLEGLLEGVTDWLMMPEYFMYKLCGNKAKEYTDATTSGMINHETGEFDEEIIARLGFDKKLFPRLSQPGTVIGTYKGIKVILCATHDTGSAVEGIPMEGNEPYISSGTWSLLGIKTKKPITTKGSEEANYSNEGGVGYNRYQKNIMGMWLINELRRDMCPDKPFTEIAEEASKSTFDELIDANGDEFFAPKSMKEAFDNALTKKPQNTGDYFRCAYRSLARSYKKAIDELESSVGQKYDKLYIVGGGAKNVFMNKLAKEETGKQIIALPIEATALGNLKIQLDTLNKGE